MTGIAQSFASGKTSRFLWLGLALFCIGTGPLLAVIVAAQLGLTRDPNPNPVGFGILAFFTFWPSVARCYKPRASRALTLASPTELRAFS